MKFNKLHCLNMGRLYIAENYHKKKKPMSISVITPHFNDYDGLLQIYKCLLAQTQASWQWVIEDDLSDTNIRKEIRDCRIDIKDDRVKLICNAKKSNASVCRNLGSNNAIYENLVFLDADDINSLFTEPTLKLIFFLFSVSSDNFYPINFNK